MPSPEPTTTQILDAWKSSMCEVLAQLTGAPVRASVAPSAAATAVHSLHFVAGKDFAGSISFALAPADAYRLTQVLLAEPLTGSGEWNADRDETLSELMRQFAGQAETAIKAAVEHEIGFKLSGGPASPVSDGSQRTWIFEGERLPQTFISISSSIELQPKIETATPREALASQPADPGSNLDVLVDVELDVTMRFGQRRMLLRDVLHLNQGSVVELDCDLQDPAELVVGGRVVARGDVVIVDGNYGLRITEVLSSPQSAAFQTA